jgi:hypothetical protein
VPFSLLSPTPDSNTKTNTTANVNAKAIVTPSPQKRKRMATPSASLDLPRSGGSPLKKRMQLLPRHDENAPPTPSNNPSNNPSAPLNKHRRASSNTMFLELLKPTSQLSSAEEAEEEDEQGRQEREMMKEVLRCTFSQQSHTLCLHNLGRTLLLARSHT